MTWGSYPPFIAERESVERGRALSEVTQLGMAEQPDLCGVILESTPAFHIIVHVGAPLKGGWSVI